MTENKRPEESRGSRRDPALKALASWTHLLLKANASSGGGESGDCFSTSKVF